MTGRGKEPHPMPRPFRWLAMFLAFVFVISLGVAATYRVKRTGDDGNLGGVSPKSVQKEDIGPHDEYAGLKSAGVPVPGEWSHQSLLSVDGTQNSDGNGAALSPVGGDGGPIDVALVTVDRILDPTLSDAEWERTMRDLFQPDMAGLTHGPSNMARYWWQQRRFQPDRLCTGNAKDMLIIQSYDCSTDRMFQGQDTEAIKGTQYWWAGTSFFDVPRSITEKIPSSTDPQTVISQYYDAVAFPMDDGVWYVTVACPAMSDHPYLDENGDELATEDDNAPSSKYWISVGSMVGVGTNQRPCRPVEITVGGQRPFWYIGADGSN